ncbi:MAG: TolC family protein, partial [Aureliella sp.]
MLEATTVIPASQIEPVDSQDVSARSAVLSEVVIDPLTTLTTQSSGFSYSLQDAIAASLMQNPDLIAARGQEQVSTAAVGVAETYIWNPFLQAQIRPEDGRGGQSNYYLWLMQRFELAHQQKFREQSANSLLYQVRWTIHQTELTNIATTSQFYFTALYQRELLDLAKQTAELNEDLLGIIERRFKAGVGTAPQVTTAKVAARQSSNQAQLANTNYQTALLALRRQLDLSPSEPLTLTDRLPAFSWHPASDFSSGGVKVDVSDATGVQLLAASLVEGRPDVMAALAGKDAACANARLAKAAQTPDVQAGPILDKNA